MSFRSLVFVRSKGKWDNIHSSRTFMKGPNNDQSTLIAGGELAEQRIPGDADHSAGVTLQGLVHRKIRRSSNALQKGWKIRLKPVALIKKKKYKHT